VPGVPCVESADVPPSPLLSLPPPPQAASSGIAATVAPSPNPAASSRRRVVRLPSSSRSILTHLLSPCAAGSALP